MVSAVFVLLYNVFVWRFYSGQWRRQSKALFLAGAVSQIALHFSASSNTSGRREGCFRVAATKVFSSGLTFFLEFCAHAGGDGYDDDSGEDYEDEDEDEEDDDVEEEENKWNVIYVIASLMIMILSSFFRNIF